MDRRERAAAGRCDTAALRGPGAHGLPAPAPQNQMTRNDTSPLTPLPVRGGEGNQNASLPRDDLRLGLGVEMAIFGL